MRHISLKSIFARLTVTLLLMSGSISASAQYYLNVYEKSGSSRQFEIANLDSVSITDIKVIDPTKVLTVLSINKNKVNIETGDSTILSVKGYDADGVDIPIEGVVWESKNPFVASVNEDGKVTAMAKGNTTIIASLNNISVSCDVTVRDKFVNIDVTIDSLAKSGVYMGVMGFNKQLYTKPIRFLNSDSKNTFDNFIDSMEMKNGTLLCYSVDNALDSLGSAVLPDNLTKVAIVTFTDGLDQGSIDMIEAVTGQYYDSDDEYLDAIKQKLTTYSLAGIPITAYSVGVRGSDVKDLSKFQATLKQLASSNDYAIEVNNMSELNKTFKAIADTLNRARNYQTVPIVMPGLSNGTRVRFTFDNVSDANKSTLYIEGTYNRRERTLIDVEYHGMTSTSGEMVVGEISEVIFTKFTFESIHTNDNTFINKSFINEWYMTSDGAWQVNSEFDPDQQPDIEMEQSSMLIMLVLDCSSSLGDEFTTVQSVAKNFINTLYSAAGGNENNGGVNGNNELNDNYSLYSKKPIDLSLAISIDGERYYLTEDQYHKANLSKSIIEGVTVVTGTSNFIVALQNEPSNNMLQENAIAYYGSNLPTKTQGEIISARWSYINNAIKAFGGTEFSSSFWTGYRANSGSYPCYYTYSGGGKIETNTTSSTNPVRLVKSCDSHSPIIWRDNNDLKLVVYKGSEIYFYSTDQWQIISNKDEYEKKGVYIATGGISFIVALQNEPSNNMLQENAIAYYGSNLPTKTQGEIISARWSYINNAIKAFGGTEFSSSFWTGYRANSGSYPCYYTYSGGGKIETNTTSSTNPVRLVYPYFNKIELSDTILSLLLDQTYTMTASLMNDNNIVSGDVKWVSDNPSVVSVNNNGRLTGIGIGTAKITAYSHGLTPSSQDINASCIVNIITPEAVDLGLSVKWATCNVGSGNPVEYGKYYAWGETETKTKYGWSTYKFCNGNFNYIDKYRTFENGYGVVDNKTILEADDDVAQKRWGANGVFQQKRNTKN